MEWRSGPAGAGDRPIRATHAQDVDSDGIMAVTVEAPSGAKDGDGRKAPKGRATRLAAPYLFLAPYLAFLFAFGVAPIAYALYLSLTSTTGDPGHTNALSNYSVGNSDFRFRGAADHIGLYILIWLPTLIIVIFVAAFLLEAKPGRTSTVLRVIFYIPGSLAGSAAVLVWLFMFDPSVSPFKPIFEALGLHSVNQVISGNFIAAAIAVMALSTGAGGWIVIVYGALRGLPSETLEAAQIDGCGPLRMATSIKFPQVKKYVILIAILSFATGTQVFVEPSLLFASSIGFISPTWSINELSYYYAFTYGRFGVSAALSIELFLISLILAVIVIFRTDFYSTAVD
jgi:multiple sugar transport system permease protein